MKLLKKLNLEKKQIIAFILTLCLILSAVPLMSATVLAADEHSHTGWSEWATADSLPTVAGNYYLSADVTLSAAWDVPEGETKLCLNGHTVKQTAQSSVIAIGAEEVLTVFDCPGGGVITGGNLRVETGDGGGVHNLGTFIMYGGSIKNNYAYDSGGGIYNEGTFLMYGGDISSNNTYSSGSIGEGSGVCNSGTFTMYDGIIQGNDTSYGGAIINEKTFTMHGGVIQNNTSSWGGAIYNCKKAVITMTGGTFKNNVSSWQGGAILNYGTLDISGGEIINNTAGTYGGGGVYTYTDATLLLSGNPVIKNNIFDGSPSNLYMAYNSYDTSQAILDLNSDFCGEVYIHMPIPGVFSRGGAGLERYFYSDNEGYEILKLGENLTMGIAQTVSFDMQGYAQAIPTQKVINGGLADAPSEPKQAGYIFNGWYKESGCVNAWDFANDIVLENITLYAKWTVCNHIYSAVTDAECNECGYVRALGDQLIKEDGVYCYYKDGVKSTATTLVKYNGVWFYIENGVWVKKSTLVKYNGSWFYVKNGKWDAAAKKEPTLVKYNGVYFYVVNGKWNSKTNDLIKYQDNYFFIKNGKWDKATTLFKKSGKWFSVKNGKWNKTAQIITYSGKKFYCNKGFAQLGFTGKAKVGSKTYNIVKGQVK